ncbi:unnamed protein product [Phaedon cochleariae]|uniref:DUF7064 domain-containing protein n=1 Tax=Phaedon cochleariae TaxID=80249 RepID=A0A9P0GV37_PHACE|nr:unnamed protein product [Phaedon cochleariae]
MIFGAVIGILIIFVIIKKGLKSRDDDVKRKPKRIFGVYAPIGKWYYFKYFVFRALLILRRLKYRLCGKRFFHKENVLEKLQTLSNHKLAFDAVFFHAVTQDGMYFCCGIERRHEAKVVGLVYLVLPEYGILESETLPKTTMDADTDSIYYQKCYSGGGLTMTPVKPMKKWKVQFRGKMRVHNSPNKTVDIELEADWHSDYKWFFFEVDVPSKVLARAIARETWDKEYFQRLKEAHQSHYEQMGYLSGKLKVDGKTIKLEEVDAFRDHSFGHKRDWSLMHRYIYHMFYLSDRTKIAIGVVSQPSTTSLLEMGFVNHPDGRLDPVESVDLVLYEHGEDGVMPAEMAFTFVAGGETYDVRVEYVQEAVHYKGSDIEARLHERFIVCEVNGVPGRGISEWHYNNCQNKEE